MAPHTLSIAKPLPSALLPRLHGRFGQNIATKSAEAHHGTCLCSLPQYSAFIKIVEFAAHEMKAVTSSSHVLHMEDSPPFSADSGICAASSPKSPTIVGVMENSNLNGNRFTFNSSVTDEAVTKKPGVPTSRARFNRRSDYARTVYIASVPTAPRNTPREPITFDSTNIRYRPTASVKTVSGGVTSRTTSSWSTPALPNLDLSNIWVGPPALSSPAYTPSGPSSSPQYSPSFIELSQFSCGCHSAH